jgi:hypothetical protein
MSLWQDVVVVALLCLSAAYLVGRFVYRRSGCSCCRGNCADKPEYGQTLVAIQRPAADDDPRSSSASPDN